MSSLGDSDSICSNKIFPQHQSILTIIQGKLDNPLTPKFNWLDLACGRGQIISQIKNNLGSHRISKINYYGYDIENKFIKHTEELCKSAGLKFESKIGEIEDFTKHYKNTQKFDLITLTNALHEFNSNKIAFLLFECLIRLNTDGCLFIYDIESTNPLELGAVNWEQSEISSVLKKFLDLLNIKNYFPEPGRWLHSTCHAWNIQIYKNYLNITDDKIKKVKQTVLNGTQKLVKEIIFRKLTLCKQQLESLTNCGIGNDDERKTIHSLLYQFWALNSIKERMK